ncbi:MAG TPA: hypothetical protein VER55_12700, partial [Ardenticatenaceae bacterium]|nr:hypothetical protein [Ardenticatenaceae bacterium]
MRDELLWLALLVAAIWLPRGLGLNRFVAIDERKWLVRSGNFYQALAHGDYTNTIQQQHPGVTTTWAGAAGFVWRYPAYAREVPGQLGSQKEEIEPFLRA